MSQSSPGHVSFLGPRTQNDAAGNLTTDRQGYTYEYDYENRITKILKAGPVTVAEYSYDALGRRVEKKDSVTSTNTRRYYYDKDWRVLDEYDGSGTLKRRYMCGNYIDEVLFSWVAPPGTHRYYVHDHLYSPVALLWYDSVSWSATSMTPTANRTSWMVRTIPAARRPPVTTTPTCSPAGRWTSSTAAR